MNERIKAWQGKMSELRPRPQMSRGAAGELVTVGASSEIKNNADVIRVSFHERVLAMTGWKDGDRMDAAIDGDHMIVFRSEAGPMLCRNKGGGKKVMGTRRYIRFPLPLGSVSDFPRGVCREIETGPGKVAFLLPATK